MKRKFYKALSFMTSLMLLTSTIPVYASESFSSTVTADVESTYVVSIPKSLGLEVDSIGVGTVSYETYAQGDTEAGKSVYIVPDGSFNMTKAGSSNTVVATVEQTKTEWTSSELLGDSPIIGNGTITAMGLTTGTWDGVFYFNITKDDSGSSIGTVIDETKEVELIEGQTVDAGTFTLGRSQVGAVSLSYDDTDVTTSASYSSDNPNITVDKNGVINTDNASGGESATITATYTYTDKTEMASAFSYRGNGVLLTASIVPNLYASEVQEVEETKTLTAHFKVQVIDIVFDTDTLRLEQGQSATITADVLPDEVNGEVTWSLAGLDFGTTGNSITINVAEDATPGNYTLIASYGTYMQSLSIQIVSKHICDYGEGVITTEPTCDKDGVRTFTCECGSSYTEVEPSGGHSYSGKVTTEEKCLTDGVKTYTCSTCGDSYTEIIPALKHNYVDGVCSRCGETDPNSLTKVTLRGDANIANEGDEFLGLSYNSYKPVYREYVFNIVFTDWVEGSGHTIGDEGVFDVSAAGDGSIVAWLVTPGLSDPYNTSGGGSIDRYSVFIAPTKENTIISLPANSSMLFSHLTSIYHIYGLETVDFSNVVNGTKMFYKTPLTKIQSFDMNFKNLTTATSMFEKSGTVYSGALSFPRADFSKLTTAKNMFKSQTKLTSIEMPGLKLMDKQMFYGCTNLAEIKGAESAVQIHEEALTNCKALTTLNLGPNVTMFSGKAMPGCAALTTVAVDSGNATFKSVDGVVYSKDGTTLVYYPAGKITAESTVVINEGVTKIGECAFRGCTSLTSISLPSTLKEIEEGAFQGCTALTSITLPEGVDTVGSNLFKSCTSLSTVVLPSTITSLSDYMFSGCTVLNNINLDNVATIGKYTFEKCSGLSGNLDLSNITSLGDYSFLNCAGVTNVTLPSVAPTGEYVFKGCTGIANITIPANYTAINNGMFYGCAGITAIDIPSNVTSIGDSAFYDCTSLIEVMIPDNVVSLGKSVFSGCDNLTDVIIGNGITSLNFQEFGYCPKLESVFIPSSVTTINVTSGYNSPFFCGSTGTSSCKIYCEAASKPSGFASAWNYYTYKNTLSVAYGISKEVYISTYK